MTDSLITVDCQISGQKYYFEYDLENTLELFMSDLQDQEPPMGSHSLYFFQEGYVFVNGNRYPFSPNRRATLSSLGATANSIIVVSEAVMCGGYRPVPSGLESPITVYCHITSCRFDIDYDLDNTLEMFISDLQDHEPPMGFSPSKANTLAGVFVNGNAHIFSANPQATLSSLGATKNSVIEVTASAHVDGGPPPAPSGLKNKRARTTLTSKRARKPIVKRAHVGLISVDIDALSDFEVIKLAALNGCNEALSGAGAQQRIEELKSWLRRLKAKGSVRTKIPDKFQDKSVETAIGELPFENFVLWCTATDTLPDGALHTLLNADSLGEDSPSGDIVNLLGKPCQKSNCQGTIRLWDYASTPPK